MPPANAVKTGKIANSNGQFNFSQDSEGSEERAAQEGELQHR